MKIFKKILKILTILLVIFSFLISAVSIFIVVNKQRAILYAQCLVDDFSYGANCQFRTIEHLGCAWIFPSHMKYNKDREKIWFSTTSFLNANNSIIFYNDQYQPIKVPGIENEVENDLKIRTYFNHNDSISHLFIEITRDNYKGAVVLYNANYYKFFLKSCNNQDEQPLLPQQAGLPQS